MKRFSIAVVLLSVLIAGDALSEEVSPDRPQCPIDPRAADVPEVLYTFDSFDHDTHIKVIRALRTSIPESIEKRSLWLRRFHSDDTHEEVFQGEISMTYFNLLNLVDGYALKLEFLAADENSRADKERQFCEFIRSAVIMD